MSGDGYSASAIFTPAAGAYSAGDIMEGAKALGIVGPTPGGEILITSARLHIDHTAIISGETSYELHLYNATPPSALVDNAAWTLSSADGAVYVGKISLGAPADLGANLFVGQTGINLQVTVPTGGQLYGYLVTVGGFTATAAARRVVVKAIAL